MKKYLICAIIFNISVIINGCTTTSWIKAAGEAMQAKDAYDKKIMSNRLKRANAATSQKK